MLISGSFFRAFVDSTALLGFVFTFRAYPRGGALKLAIFDCGFGAAPGGPHAAPGDTRGSTPPEPGLPGAEQEAVGERRKNPTEAFAFPAANQPASRSRAGAFSQQEGSLLHGQAHQQQEYSGVLAHRSPGRQLAKITGGMMLRAHACGIAHVCAIPRLTLPRPPPKGAAHK